MAKYLTNSVINFTNRTVNNYDVEDYFSMDFNKLSEYIDSCPSSWFDWYQIPNNSKIEKISLDIYGDANYWDILILINHRNPIFDMPYEYDTLYDLAEDRINEYINDVYVNKSLDETAKTIMIEAYKERLVAENELLRVIKIVKPTRLQTFIQGGYEQGYFK